MQRDFLGREKRMWVAGLPFFIKKSENPQGTTLRMICEEVWPRPQPEGGDPRVVRERNHVDPIYGSKDIKIGKEGCVSVFRGQRRKEKKKKKKKRRKESAGERRTVATGAGRLRQAPDTRRPSAGAPQLQRCVDTCRPKAGPNRDASRADPRLCGGGRAWQAGARGRRARVQPAIGAFPRTWPRTPSVLLARERAWNGQFGPVAFCLPDFCPGSSSNTVLT
ncbi:uncharacterized protein LOC111461993 [Cucurbita moschata]|uniref:Uncharacterized protein LOC111461993 n=1 Tax=Cucurbita moschata TaxID=3662 RepID=A0A6J1HBQ8_CUCMO|nr:uncharacterized protein LOC111461993 [Cucurbita moschata]